MQAIPSRPMRIERSEQETFIARLIAPGFAVDPSKALSGQLYMLLRAAIVTMTLLPNDVIVERAIADALGISRTPIREALQQLAREELVRIAPQSGTFVAPVRREQFEESALVRQVLEAASIRRAAQVITREEMTHLQDIHEAHRRAIARRDAVAAIAHDNAFHATLCSAARLPRVQHLIELVRAPIDRVRHVAVRDAVVAEVTLQQHEAILVAVERHDPDAAEQVLTVHLSDAFARQQLVYDHNVDVFTGEPPVKAV